MRTTILPPHLAAQTFASQPTPRPQAPATPDAAAQGGFEALAIKTAAPTRIIAPRPAEVKPSASAPPPAPVSQPASASAQAPALERLLRPGSRLDIRV